MEELAIVRRRSRIWPILLALILLGLVILVALYVIGGGGAINVGSHLGVDPWTPAAGGAYGTA